MMWMRAEKSIIYGVDQYVSVDLIETKTVAPHKYFALTKVYVWEQRQMMQQDLYIFSRRDYGTYPFLKYYKKIPFFTHP